MTKLGTVFFEVRPQTAGFGAELRRATSSAVAGLDKNVDFRASINTRNLREEVTRATSELSFGRGVYVPVEPRTATLRTDVDRAVARAAAGIRAQIGTEADTAGYRLALKAAVASAAKSIRADIGTDVNAAALRAELSAAVRSAEAATPDIAVGVRPETSTFIASLRSQIAGVIASVGGPANALGLGLAAAIAGGFAAGIGSASRFESGLSAVRAVAGATEAQMEAVRAKALQLGADTVFSATDATNAMEELVKAGLSVEQVLSGAADAAVSLAAAGGVSLETAATIAANALNQFGLGSAQVARVADIVAGAANASAIGVDDFALSLQQAGAVARTAGLSFDDTALAIAAMGNAGIRGSDAGTSLKTFLQNLIPVTERQKKEFRELGLVTEDGANQFFTASGRVRSLAEIGGVLETALRGMKEQQRLATLEVLFGSDAIRAAAILAREGAAGLRNLSAEMRDTTAAEVAATRMDNLAGSFEQFRGSLETVLIQMGTPLQSGLRGIIDLGTGGLNALSGLGKSSGLAADTLGDLTGVGQDVVRLLGNVVRHGAPAVEVLAKLGGGAVLVGLQALTAVLGPVAGMLSENSAAASVLSAVLIGRLGVAVAGLVADSALGRLVLQGAAATRMFIASTAATVALVGPLGAARIGVELLGASLLRLAANPLTWVALGGAAFVQVTQDIRRMKDEAQSATAALVNPALESNSYAAVGKAAKETAEKIETLIAKRNELAKPGLIRSPFDSAEIRRLDEQINAWEEGEKRLDRFAVKARENIAAISNATGMGAEAIGLLAAELKVDIAGPFTATTTKIIEAAKAQQASLLGLGSQAERSAAELEVLRKAEEELAGAMATSFGSAASILGQVGNAASDVGKTLQDAFKDAAPAGGGPLGFLRGQLAEAQRFQGDIARLVAAGVDPTVVRELAQAGPQAAGTAVAGILREVRAGNTAAVNETVASLRNAQQAVKGQSLAYFREQVAETAKFRDNLKELVAAGIDPQLIRQLAEAGPEAAAGAAAGIVAEVRSGNTQAINQTQTDLRLLLEESTNIARSQIPAIHGVGVQLGGALGGGMSSALQGVAAAVRADTRNIFPDIALLAADARAKGNTIGTSLIAGTAAGMADTGPIAEAAARAVNAAAEAARRVGRIFSPSRLFAEQVGAPMSLGIAVGMREQSRAVVAQAEAILRSVAAVDVPRIEVPTSLSSTALPSASTATPPPDTVGTHASPRLVVEHLEVHGAAQPRETAADISYELSVLASLVGG